MSNTSVNTLVHLNIAEALELMRSGDITAIDLVDAHATQMAKMKPLNAYITETLDLARQAAAASEARYKAGKALPLDGIPLAIKDLFCTEGVETTAASKILHGFVPSYESTITQRLKDAGAAFLGKLNCDEFGMGSANLNSAAGPCYNPWRGKNDGVQLVPGGSSGGSAAAVSAYAAMGATGTDTGGSIRQPAAFCGIVGLKPTYGRCSRYGMIAFASSLDTGGPIARTVKDCALMLQAMAGHDPKDPTTMEVEVPDYLANLSGNVKGVRVGIPREYHHDSLRPEINAMWDKAAAILRDAGAIVKEVSLPHTTYALPTYYILAPSEASSNLARFDGVRYGQRVDGETLDQMYEITRAQFFGSEVKTRVLIGSFMLSSGYYDDYYLKAQKVRRLILQDFKDAFQEVDVMLSPSTPNTAFAADNPPTDPIVMYRNDILTVPVSLAGLPALALPGGLCDEGLPMGLQLIGNHFQEDMLFRVGDVLETAIKFPLLQV